MDDTIMWALGTWAALDVPFWLIILGTHLLCDKWGWGTKIQPGKSPPDDLVAKTKMSVAVDNLVVHPAICFFLGRYAPGWGFGAFGSLPSVWLWLMQLAAFHFCAETFFYFTHRALHSAMLYKRFHKQHHEYKVCIGIASEFASPFEVVFSNIIPFVAGPCLCTFACGVPVHFSVWAAYTALYIWETVDAHSGYELPAPIRYPFGSNALRHDWHHSHNNGNYGTFLCIWDRVLGTDAWARAQEKASKAKREAASAAASIATPAAPAAAAVPAAAATVSKVCALTSRKSPRRLVQED